MNGMLLLERPLRKTTKRLFTLSFCVLCIAIACTIFTDQIIYLLPIEPLEISEAHHAMPSERQEEVTISPVFPERPLKETLFLPKLVTSIQCFKTPERPDRDHHGRYFSFVGAPRAFVPYGATRYLRLTEEGFSLSEEETPLELHLTKDEVHLSLSVVTSDNIEVLSASHSCPISALTDAPMQPHTQEFRALCEHIDSLKVYPPDAFFATYGGATYNKRGQLFRLGNLQKYVYGIEPGSIFTLHHHALVPLEKPYNAECPLLQVVSVTSSAVVVDIWNTSGDEYARRTLQPAATKAAQIKQSELFSDIRVRGRGRALAKSGKKTISLQKGDYLLRKGTSWRVIHEKDGLERLINYLDCGTLFVFEGIVQKRGSTLFTGRLFDETRSISTPIELPVTTKNKQLINRRPRRIEVKQEPPQGMSAEIEELLEELDEI